MANAVFASHSSSGNCPYFEDDVRTRKREKESPIWEILGKEGLAWAENSQKECSGTVFWGLLDFFGITVCAWLVGKVLSLFQAGFCQR